MKARFLIALLAAAALLSACSFSESSKSSSASSKSISDLASSPSSLSSMSKESKKANFENDVRDYTAEFVKSSAGDLPTFRAKLAKIAEKYGVSQWDADKSTYVAIGKGLFKAKLSQPQYAAFKSSLGDATPWKMDAIQEGYR